MKFELPFWNSQILTRREGAINADQPPGAAARSCAVERSRGRLVMLTALLSVAFCACAWQLAQVSFAVSPSEVRHRAQNADNALRADVLDRNGALLARDVTMLDIWLKPGQLEDGDATADAIGFLLPNIDAERLKQRFRNKPDFAYIKRKATPHEAELVHSLGLPDITYEPISRRVYPKAELFSHVVGFVNIDNVGQAGVERAVDKGLLEVGSAPVGKRGVKAVPHLSLDARVQHAVRDELLGGVERYGAKAGVALVLDVNNGEVWSMVSVPDFNPNRPGRADPEWRRNRAVGSVYELGSVFKPFTFALGLDRGDFTLNDTFDAREPFRIGGRTIRDFHPQRRVLTAVEVFLHSSNIGTAQMALATGTEPQRAFLSKLGLTRKSTIELTGVSGPIVSDRWRSVETATISYGHGIAVSPMQLASASAALVNGGFYIEPTILKRADGAIPEKRRVIKPETSEMIRLLMRANVADESGSGSGADVAGYEVGGKTGTAEKVVGGRYVSGKRVSSFVGIFPSSKPAYLVFVLLDEPTTVPENKLQAPTGGATAAPLAGRIINRIIPMMGLRPIEPAKIYREISYNQQ